MHDPTPEEYTPPQTRLGETWRYLGALAISLLTWIPLVEKQWHHSKLLFGLDIALGLVGFAAIRWRRRHPFGTALMVNAFGFASALASGPALLISISLATRRTLWQILVVAGLTVVAGLAYDDIQPQDSTTPWWATLLLVLFVVTAISLGGMYLGSRRELLWTLRERARAAEEQQGLRIAAARVAERQNIAREMHDVLAHRISMVSMHAGALAYRSDLPAEQVKETATLIQHNAHAALTDLREVLGVLRGGDVLSGDRPQPTLDDVPELVEEAQRMGMQVVLHADVPSGLSPLGSRTIYRVIQEGLTNARKHAPDAHVTVQIAGSPADGCHIWVRNPPHVSRPSGTPGAGVGLVGLRERAELAGGRLEVSQDSQGFVLHVWVPWEPQEGTP